MEQKHSFIYEWLASQTNVKALCESYGICRTLGFRYIRRYLEDGSMGLQE